MASAEMTILIDTANHRHSARHCGWDESPAELCWGDLGADLGTRFAASCEKLERLMYVIYGSPPLQYSPSFKDWIHRRHPRCLWGGERAEQKWCGTVDAFGNPVCTWEQQHTEFYEYLALGHSVGIPAPQVPIRSRSGDPLRQMLDATGDRTRFPSGSVTRTDGFEVHDPRGHGFFGGDPAQIGADGPDEIAGEAVTVSWTPPPAIATAVSAVELHTSLAAPNDVLTMVLAAGTWSATIPAQEHGTTVQWHLEATIDGVVYREPLSGSYSYVAFTHYNPYAAGFPEMLDVCRKGTDRYQFEESECIQPALINMFRYALDYLGNRFVHSPKPFTFREQEYRTDAGANALRCCAPTYIKWRWSGSAKWPLFVAGGKYATAAEPDLAIHPIHNLEADIDPADPDYAAAMRARSSWRGYPRPYGDTGGWDSWSYPAPEHDASWLSPMEHVGISEAKSALRWWAARDPMPGAACRIWWDSSGRGLQAGDVITRVHIEELIWAVDYLLANGLWVQVDIKRRPKTPGGTFIDGLPCGWTHYTNSYLGTDTTEEMTQDFGQCCWFIYGSPPCVSWPEPADWEDCWSAVEKVSAADGLTHAWGHGACPIQEEYIKGYRQAGIGGPFVLTQQWNVFCGSNYGQIVGESYCGGTSGGKNWDASEPTYPWLNSCSSRVRGWEAWVCGPEQCPGGVDADHGNSAGWKLRNDHVCPVSSPLYVPAYRYGNCFDFTFSCAEVVDAGDENLGFQTVRAVRWRGACNSWLGWCDDVASTGTECVQGEDVPAVAGLPSHYDWDGDPTCETGCRSGVDWFTTNWVCDLDVPECDHDKQWARIDLNLGGAGYASAAGMPVLKAYATSPQAGVDPVEAVKCPCETDDPTAPASCA